MTENARGGCQKQGLLVSTRASSTNVSKPENQKTKNNKKKQKITKTTKTNNESQKKKKKKKQENKKTKIVLTSIWSYLT